MVDIPSDFHNQLETITKLHYPAKDGVSYKLDAGLYEGGTTDIEPIHRGIKILDGVTKHFNDNGELDDYTDGDSGKIPAVKSATGDYAHYRNGLLHNESGIAKQDNGFKYHAINGGYHRVGDLPAIYSDNGFSKIEKYYVGGVLHRDGDKPTVSKTDKLTNYSELNYHKAGMLHRDGDKPAFIKSDMNGKSEEYYHRGLKHRDGDNPADIVHNDNYSIEKYFKHGKLHRDDKPAYISTHVGGGMKHIEHQWYNNGIQTKSEKIVYDGTKLHLHEINNYNNDGVITKSEQIRPDSKIIRDNKAKGNEPNLTKETNDSIQKSYYHNPKGVKEEYIPKDGNTADHTRIYDYGVKLLNDDTIKLNTGMYHEDKHGIHYLDQRKNVTTVKPNGDILHSKNSLVITKHGVSIGDTIKKHLDEAHKSTDKDLDELSYDLHRNGDTVSNINLPDKQLNMFNKFNKAINK